MIKEGETLNILRQDVGDGWWEAQNSEGVRGLVPEAYLEVSTFLSKNVIAGKVF